MSDRITELLKAVIRIPVFSEDLVGKKVKIRKVKRSLPSRFKYIWRLLPGMQIGGLRSSLSTAWECSRTKEVYTYEGDEGYEELDSHAYNTFDARVYLGSYSWLNLMKKRDLPAGLGDSTTNDKKENATEEKEHN